MPDDYDVPVIRQDVDNILRIVEARHNQAGNDEDDDEHTQHKQGDERLVAQSGCQSELSAWVW